MYGLIGKLITAPDKRDELAAILGSMGAMPGCLSYVVATEPSDPTALWITEIWEDEAAHAASLQLPTVQAAMATGRPLVSGFGDRVETRPVGGIGLV